VSNLIRIERRLLNADLLRGKYIDIPHNQEVIGDVDKIKNPARGSKTWQDDWVSNWNP